MRVGDGVACGKGTCVTVCVYVYKMDECHVRVTCKGTLSQPPRPPLTQYTRYRVQYMYGTSTTHTLVMSTLLQTTLYCTTVNVVPFTLFRVLQKVWRVCVYLCGDGGVGWGLGRGLGVLGGGELGGGVPTPPHSLLLLLLLLVLPFVLLHLQRPLECGSASGFPPAEAEGRNG